MRGAEHSPAERRAGASHVAENAAATGAVAHAIQEGTFVVVLISGEAWPAVFTGGVVHVIGSMASPALEPPASSTPPAPSLCRGCSKELTITPWRLQKFEKHGHWPVRCYVCNAKRAAASQSHCDQAQVAHMAEGSSGAADKAHRVAQLDHSAELQLAKAAEDEAGAHQAHEVAHTAEAADSGDSSIGTAGAGAAASHALEPHRDHAPQAREVAHTAEAADSGRDSSSDSSGDNSGDSSGDNSSGGSGGDSSEGSHGGSSGDSSGDTRASATKQAAVAGAAVSQTTEPRRDQELQQAATGTWFELQQAATGTWFELQQAATGT